MYCDPRGTDKNQPGQTPGQKPPRTIEIEFLKGTFVWDFCTRPTKNQGSQRCVTYFGGSRDVRQSVTEGGGQNWPKIARRTLWTAPKKNSCKNNRDNKCNLRVFRSLGLAVVFSLQPRKRVETRDYYGVCTAVNRINFSHNLTAFQTQ